MDKSKVAPGKLCVFGCNPKAFMKSKFQQNLKTSVETTYFLFNYTRRKGAFLWLLSELFKKSYGFWNEWESAFRAASGVNVFHLSNDYLYIDYDKSVAHKSVYSESLMIPPFFHFNSGHSFMLKFSTSFNNNLSQVRKYLF